MPWAEGYLPGAGWIAFDPTHRRLGGASLIPVAVARSNRQIMPIVGGYDGAPEDFVAMEVAMSVTPQSYNCRKTPPGGGSGSPLVIEAARPGFPPGDFGHSRKLEKTLR